MIENTWNTSFRRMYDLKQTRKSKKILPNQLFNVIQFDTRSFTGNNIRKILLLTKEAKVDEITDEDIETIEYAAIIEENTWRVKLIKEITDKKFNQLEIDGFSEEECEEILQFVCVS